MNHPWEVVAEIFEAAVRLDPAQRSTLLDARCGADAELRREVEGLLRQDDAAPEYLTPPHASPRLVPALDPVRAVIGEFRILRRLGSGGMGSVFEAEQTQPARRVALKVLPALADDPSARQRFAQEAELLARMNHPSIAQIFAAGVDGDTPWLAMELVEDALPITDFGRRNDLSVRDALVLFRAVCAGVAHGHAKGVVHRDLKPSNVLVDAAGSPKVIDFGIARALETTEGAAVRMTHVGDLVGTLQYMSPEQAEGRIADVDAQSDVHGLGLILYEMLCKQRAFDLAGESLTGALRIVSAHSVASPRKLMPDLPAEVDWILGKALEKDRSRRYASVAELDADLERLLDHRPVLAGPPSRVYEARKFVRRHRVGIAALGAVFAALTIGLVAALRERSRAEQARDDLIGRTHELETETARKDRLLMFQKRMLTAASADAEGYDVRVIDLLDAAHTELALMNEEPAVALELHASLADGYSSLGRLEEGLDEYRAALSLVPAVPGFSPRRVAEMERMSLRARFLHAADPSVDAEIRALVQRHAVLFGPSDHETVCTRLALTERLRVIGAYAEAEAQARAALSACNADLHPDDAEWAQSELASVLVEVGDFKNAEPLLRSNLASRRARLGAEHWLTLSTQSTLVSVLKLCGDTAEVEELARFSAKVFMRRAGPEHPYTLRAHLTLAEILRASGRNLEAKGIVADVRAVLESISARGQDRLALLSEFAQLLSEWTPDSDAVEKLQDLRLRWAQTDDADSPNALRTSVALANALLVLGRLPESEAVLREALATAEPRLGRDSRAVALAYECLSQLLLRSNRIGEAYAIIVVNLAIQRNAQGDQHDDTLKSLQTSARALLGSGRVAEAESAVTEALEARRTRFGPLHPQTRAAQSVMADVEWASGRYSRAERTLCEAASGVDHASAEAADYYRMTSLAGMRMSLGRQWDALEAFREAHAIASRILPITAADHLDATLNLASQWRRMKQPGPVPALLEPIHDACLGKGGPSSPRARACRNMLMKSYEELGQTAELTAWRKRLDEESASAVPPKPSAESAARR